MRVLAQLGHHDRGPLLTGQLDLGLLASRLELAEGAASRRVLTRELGQAALVLKLAHRPIDQDIVQVAAAEEVVPGVIDDAQPAVLGFEQRYVEGAPSQIEDQPHAFPIRSPARGDGTGDGFLDERHLGQPGQLAGAHGRVVLGQFEQGGRRDHRGPGRKSQRIPRIGEQGSDDLGRELLGRKVLASGRERQTLSGAHQPFEFSPGVGGVGFETAIGLAAGDAHTAGVHAHNRRCQILAQTIGHDDHRVAIEDRQGRIARAEIDANEHGACLFRERTHWPAPDTAAGDAWAIDNRIRPRVPNKLRIHFHPLLAAARIRQWRTSPSWIPSSP